MHDDILTPRLRLRLMPIAFLETCLRCDWDRAEAILGLSLPPECLLENAFIELRLNDLRNDPAYAPWCVRAIGLRSSRAMIGFLGFHTRPDPLYLRPFVPRGVELGYSVATPYRRQGYAAEAIGGLLHWAHRRQGVDCFVVSIAPSNTASTALAAKLGFMQVGGHEDEIDGHEDVFALSGEALTRLLAAQAYNEEEP